MEEKAIKFFYENAFRCPNLDQANLSALCRLNENYCSPQRCPKNPQLATLFRKQKKVKVEKLKEKPMTPLYERGGSIEAAADDNHHKLLECMHDNESLNFGASYLASITFKRRKNGVLERWFYDLAVIERLKKIQTKELTSHGQARPGQACFRVPIGISVSEVKNEISKYFKRLKVHAQEYQLEVMK